MSEIRKRRCSGGCSGYYPEDQMVKKRVGGTTTYRCAPCTKLAAASQAERDAFGKRKSALNRKAQADRMRARHSMPTGFKLGD